MNWRSPRLCIAFLLSFSGCSCEWHAGTDANYRGSGGEQVIVIEEPGQSDRERAARERHQREAERQRNPRRSGDPSKSFRVGAQPAGASTQIPVGGVGPAPAPAPAPAPLPGPTPPQAQPPAPVAAPVAVPVPVPTPAPAAAAPAAPTPPPSDSYVRARRPGKRPANTGGAVQIGEPAKESDKTKPGGPLRGRAGRAQ